MTILRPFLMLASVAFVTGFAGYLTIAKVNGSASPPVLEQPAISAAVSADPAGAWDLGRRT